MRKENLRLTTGLTTNMIANTGELWMYLADLNEQAEERLVTHVPS